jgi:Endonuclease NucS
MALEAEVAEHRARLITYQGSAECTPAGKRYNLWQVPTAIRIWEVAGQVVRPIVEATLAQGQEADLEHWIAARPQIIEDGLLILDRQREIPGVGILDLLGIDQHGTLVIIELKRDRTSSEAVAQALNYASWLDSATEGEIVQNADRFERAFRDCFQNEPPEISGKNHRILLVAARLDASAERIITYLSRRYDVDINAVFFQYARLSDGKEIIARTMLVAEGARANHPTRSSHPTADELMYMANKQGVAPLVQVCRSIAPPLEELTNNVYGGCFRYHGTNLAGQSRFLFGINIPGKYNPPQSELDVWVPVRSLVEVAGRPEDEVRAMLRKHPVLDMQIGECWLRLTNTEQAEAFTKQILSLIKPVSASTASA